MQTSSCPFTSEVVTKAFDPSTAAYIEVSSDSKLYGLAVPYIAQHAADSAPHSRRVDVVGGGCHSSDEDSDSDEETSLASDMTVAKTCARPTALTIGLGLFRFSFGGESGLHALHETVGEPTANGCGSVDLYTRLVLFAPKSAGGLELLQTFCDKLIADSERTRSGTFAIFRWQTRHQYWRRQVRASARPIESVVLPEVTKSKLVHDLDNFLSPKTAKWYRKHGVPYRRSYLFHGVPGAGKTSLLQAIAGKYERNLCYASPAHPDVTDDALKTAVQSTPSQSLLVLEDIDALFTKGRTAKDGKSPLTFSGLLNALDGVGAANGQLIVLTTNFRNQLDDALIRPGRVDMHIEFGYATAEQMAMLFGQFYPHAATTDAQAFAERTTAALAGRDVAMCALQHFFIMSRTRSPTEAIESVHEIVEELQTKQSDGAAEAAPAAEDDDAKTGKTAKAKKAAKSKSSKAAARAPPPVHVHVHLPGAASAADGDADDGADGSANESESE